MRGTGAHKSLLLPHLPLRIRIHWFERVSKNSTNLGRTANQMRASDCILRISDINVGTPHFCMAL